MKTFGSTLLTLSCVLLGDGFARRRVLLSYLPSPVQLFRLGAYRNGTREGQLRQTAAVVRRRMRQNSCFRNSPAPLIREIPQLKRPPISFILVEGSGRVGKLWKFTFTFLYYPNYYPEPLNSGTPLSNMSHVYLCGSLIVLTP